MAREQLMAAGKMSQAPWSERERAAIRGWQLDKNVHPLTCPDDQTRLQVGRRGLYCVMCGYTQTLIPAMMIRL